MQNATKAEWKARAEAAESICAHLRTMVSELKSKLADLETRLLTIEHPGPQDEPAA